MMARVEAKNRPAGTAAKWLRISGSGLTLFLVAGLSLVFFLPGGAAPAAVTVPDPVLAGQALWDPPASALAAAPAVDDGVAVMSADDWEDTLVRRRAKPRAARVRPVSKFRR